MQTNGVPEVVLEWIRQLKRDKMLHEIIDAAFKNEEQMDVELTALLRMSNKHIVMEPKITVRR